MSDRQSTPQERRRAYAQRYNHSTAGRAARARFLLSPQGQAYKARVAERRAAERSEFTWRNDLLQHLELDREPPVFAETQDPLWTDYDLLCALRSRIEEEGMEAAIMRFAVENSRDFYDTGIPDNTPHS